MWPIRLLPHNLQSTNIPWDVHLTCDDWWISWEYRSAYVHLKLFCQTWLSQTSCPRRHQDQCEELFSLTMLLVPLLRLAYHAFQCSVHIDVTLYTIISVLSTNFILCSNFITQISLQYTSHLVTHSFWYTPSSLLASNSCYTNTKLFSVTSPPGPKTKHDLETGCRRRLSST